MHDSLPIPQNIRSAWAFPQTRFLFIYFFHLNIIVVCELFFIIWLAFCRVSLMKIRRSSIFIYVNPALRLFLSQLSSNGLKLFGGGRLALLFSFRNSFINFYPNWTTTTKNTFCIEFFRDVLSDNASFSIRHLYGYSNNFNILSKC